MTEFKCPEKGCDYVGATELNLRKHYKMKHGRPYEGGGAVPEGTQVEELQDQKDGKESDGSEPEFLTSTNVPVNYFSALRQIMDNNGLNKIREATISAFQHYDPEDIDELDGILKTQNVIPAKREMVLRTYRANLGLEQEEDEEVEEKEKEEKAKKAMPRDPTALTPAEIMVMSPGELMKWKSDLAQYQQALQFQQQAMSMMYGTAGGFGGQGMGGQGQMPAEFQKLKDELEAMKEEKRMQAMMAPVIAQMQEISKRLETPQTPKKSSFDDIKEMALTMKLLDSLGNGKEADGLRMEWEQKMEQMRMENEAQKDKNADLRLSAVQSILSTKVSDLERMLQNQSTPRDNLLKTLSEAEAITKTFQGLRGNSTEASMEEKKMAVISDLVKGVTNTVQPVLMEVAKGYNKGGRQGGPAKRAAPVGAVEPIEPVDATEPIEVNKFQCMNPECNNQFDVVGHPYQIQCPACGATYVDKDAPIKPKPEEFDLTEDTYVSHAKEPTDDDLMAELEKMPMEDLQQFAANRGIDPTLYAVKHDLIRELINRRK
jgi:hypothetical protein